MSSGLMFRSRFLGVAARVLRSSAMKLKSHSTTGHFIPSPVLAVVMLVLVPVLIPGLNEYVKSISLILNLGFRRGDSVPGPGLLFFVLMSFIL